jgi:glycosyltransferase involved in cell wall biosynthesis
MPTMIATRPRSAPSAATPPPIAPRHVLFLFDQLRCLDGGAERSLQRIVQLLPPDRYRASIATFWKPSDGRFLSQYPCPVHVFPLRSTCDWNGFQVARKLRRLIRCENVSIVQSFFATSDLWGGLIAKLSGCPVLISSRRDMGFLRTAKHRIAYRLLGRMYDQVHTVSEAVREVTIRDDRVSPDKVITIPNGVELDTIPEFRDKSYVRAALGLEDASHVIIDVGTIKPVKGFDDLIRAAALVCRKYPKALFVIVGRIVADGYIGELQSLIESLGLTKNIRFPGHFENVFPWLQASDVFCHVSRSDGLSNAVLEAMACGLPCVVSRVGGNPEVVADGRSGYVVPAERPEAAADRILSLLGNPDLAWRMGERSRQIIEENYTSEVMVRRMVELYDDLLEAKGL